MVELDRRRLKLDASVMVSRLCLRPALLSPTPSPLGIMSDSCSHAGRELALLGATVGLSLTVLKGERDLAMLPDAVVSEMVTLIPLTPETAECVSQSLD